MSYAKIRPRRGTAYEWNTENPILHEGEFVLEVPDTGVGTGLSKFKIGDGVSPYRNLPYAFDGAAASAINGGGVDSFHLIQIRAGTSKEWETINPVLEVNEIAYDSTYNSFKMGDGVKAWKELKFINAASDMNSELDFGNPEEYNPNYSPAAINEEEPMTYNTRGIKSTIPEGATIADLIPNGNNEESIEKQEEVVEEETGELQTDEEEPLEK